MSIDFEKNIEFLFRNMEDEIKERNRKRAEIWALKSFRDRSPYLMVALLLAAAYIGIFVYLLGKKDEKYFIN